MDKIKFAAYNFIDTETMGVTGFATDEQMQQVRDVSDRLNKKYKYESGCKNHPDKEQEIVVTIFDKFVDFQIQPKDTCGCHDIVQKLINIRNKEMMSFNPDSFKDSTAST